jgi:diguanylate cyclase (GGDEF)-like protein
MARQLHKLSQHDPLTSLLNRRALHTRLSETYLQQFHCYSVIVIDIDHFKPINDHYGHSIGDAVLAKVGRILRLYTDEHCQAFRLGGEEFALVLQGAPLEKALVLAETLRRHIEHSPLVRDAYTITLTASLGVAEGRASIQRLEQVLNAADRAMYVAKQQGRNCVSHDTPIGSLAPSPM